MQTKSIEIQRNNVTLAGFYSYVKRQCAKKGLEVYYDFDLLEEKGMTIGYSFKDGKKVYDNGQVWSGDGCTCAAEFTRNEPFDKQVYILWFDGTCYNEIFEFIFDDEKTGHGYYYQMNRPANVPMVI